MASMTLVEVLAGMDSDRERLAYVEREITSHPGTMWARACHLLIETDRIYPQASHADYMRERWFSLPPVLGASVAVRRFG